MGWNGIDKYAKDAVGPQRVTEGTDFQRISKEVYSMKRDKMKMVILVTGIFVMSLMSSHVQEGFAASVYPERYISLIVPYAAGGGFDTQARILAPTLKKHLPNQRDIIVRNVTGAGGRVGSVELIKAKPDGYTIGLLDTGSLAIVQAMDQLGGLDLRKDLIWLGRTESPGFLLLMPTKGRFKSVREFKGQQVRTGFTTQEAAQTITLVKALGGQPYATAYSGTAEVIPALRRNDVDLYMVTYTSGLKYLASAEGELMAGLICRTDKRPELPNVPNLKDVGLESMASVLGGDRLLAAPAGLPEDVKKILGEAIGKATIDPEFVSNMEKAGYIPAGGANPEELKNLVSQMFGALLNSKDQWAPVLIK